MNFTSPMCGSLSTFFFGKRGDFVSDFVVLHNVYAQRGRTAFILLVESSEMSPAYPL